MRTIAAMRALDDTTGAVRVEDVFDTDVEDLWDACTRPERLARWIAEVDGDPQVGATVSATFTSTWSGAVRIEVCERPHHLLLRSEPGTDEETELEAWLTDEGGRTRLVVEERGHPLPHLHAYGAGWQAHLEDLGRSLQGEPSAWRTRWAELAETYKTMPVG